MFRTVLSPQIWLSVCFAVSITIPTTAVGQFTFVRNYTGVNVTGNSSNSPQYGAPVINEAGNVAFGASVFPSSIFSGTYYSKIFYGSGSTLTEVTALSGPQTSTIVPPGFPSVKYGDRLSTPSINNSNQVSYAVSTGGNSPANSTGSINIWKAGSTTTFQSSSTLTTSFFNSQALTDSGAVVYTVRGSSQETLNPDGSVTSRSLAGASTAGTNSQGNIVALTTNASVSSLQFSPDASSNFVNITGSVRPLTNDNYRLDIGDTAPPIFYSINDLGMVAYQSSNIAGGIFVTNSLGIPTLRYTIPSGLSDSDGMLSLNREGDLLIQQKPVGASTGELYFLTAGANTPVRIIGTGDSFLGSTITDVLISTNSLNDNDLIAFEYNLATGARGVAVLQINVVPEAGTIVFAGIGMLLAAVTVVRRRFR